MKCEVRGRLCDLIGATVLLCFLFGATSIVPLNGNASAQTSSSAYSDCLSKSLGCMTYFSLDLESNGYGLNDVTVIWKDTNACGVFKANTGFLNFSQNGVATWQYGPGIGSTCTDLHGTVTATLTFINYEVTCTDPNGGFAASLTVPGPNGTNTCTPAPNGYRNPPFTVTGFYGQQSYNEAVVASASSQTSSASIVTGTTTAASSSTGGAPQASSGFSLSNPEDDVLIGIVVIGLALLILYFVRTFLGDAVDEDISDLKGQLDDLKAKMPPPLPPLQNSWTVPPPGTGADTAQPATYQTNPPKGYGALEAWIFELFQNEIMLTTSTPPPQAPGQETSLPQPGSDADVVSITNNDEGSSQQPPPPPPPPADSSTSFYSQSPGTETEGSDFWAQALKEWVQSLPPTPPPAPSQPTASVVVQPSEPASPPVNRGVSREIDPVLLWIREQHGGGNEALFLMTLWLMGALPDQTTELAGISSEDDDPTKGIM